MSLTEQIDTTTPGGKLIFHLMGALAEFERDLIRERTNAGLAAGRRKRAHWWATQETQDEWESGSGSTDVC